MKNKMDASEYFPEKIEYKGMLVRKGTYDKHIVDEQKVYCDLDFKDKVVLDIGANIGAFACYAINGGACRVICYEPDPENFEMLSSNLYADERAIAFPYAVIGDLDLKAVDLYVNKGINKGLHSLYVKRGRDKIQVCASPILRVLEKHRPDIVKIDTEGAEYDILRNFKFDGVQQLAIEFHLTKKGWREDMRRYVDKIVDAGFKIVKEPKNTGKNWATVGVFKR